MFGKLSAAAVALTTVMGAPGPSVYQNHRRTATVEELEVEDELPPIIQSRKCTFDDSQKMELQLTNCGVYGTHLGMEDL